MVYYVARTQVEDCVVYAAEGAALAGKLLTFKKQLRLQFTSFYPVSSQSTNAWFSKLGYADLNQPKPQDKFN